MADKYDEEIARILALLRQTAKENRFSIRSLERKQGVSGGLTRKVLNGDMTFTFRHLLTILDALDIEWSRFFHFAYPAGGKETPEIEAETKLGQPAEDHPSSEAEPKAAGRLPAAEAVDAQAIAAGQFLVGLIRLLQEAGFDLLPKKD